MGAVVINLRKYYSLVYTSILRYILFNYYFIIDS